MKNDKDSPRDSLGPVHDEIYQPDHYRWIPGIECKDVVRHFPFMLGNAIKYIWRAGKKGDRLKDLQKARECLDNEIKVLEDKCQCTQNYPRVKMGGPYLCIHCGKED
jgi:hypothetical protein